MALLDRIFAAPVGGEARRVEFVTFGEATGVPVQILAAELSVAAPRLTQRAVGRFLCSAELTVEQDAVPKGVPGKLRFPLPQGATVTRFEFQRACPERGGELAWYPAVPLAKRKAKEVAYREKEKGRDVAVASEVAGGGNVFEIEVAPLRSSSATERRSLPTSARERRESSPRFSSTFPKSRIMLTIAPAPTALRTSSLPTLSLYFADAHSPAFSCCTPSSPSFPQRGAPWPPLSVLNSLT